MSLSLPRMRTAFIGFVIVGAMLALTSCAGMSAWGKTLNNKLHGVSATMTTYNFEGQIIDEVHGTSFNVSRDTEFDTSDSEGNSNKDSQVMLISLGGNEISHVGSAMILAEDGLDNVMTGDVRQQFSNSDHGTPWLNNLKYRYQNVWKGKARTVMIRSQNGTPIAVYVADEFEIYSTDVPKSTFMQLDGKYLFVYRCDYTIYDNALLK